jgi:lipopolysaccharide export LptBFGC system permease protein LptF
MNVGASSSSHGSEKMIWIFPVFIIALLVGVILYAVIHKKMI